MPVSKEDFPEKEFYSRNISLTANDCETLYYLVEESGISNEQKERLQNKLKGYFVSPATQLKSHLLLQKRAKKYRRMSLR